MSLIDILYNSPCGVITCAPEPPFGITRINDVVARWISLSDGQAINLPLVEVIPAAQGAWLTAITRASASHESMRLDGLVLLWPDGKMRSVTLLCLPVVGNASQEPNEIVTVIIDAVGSTGIPRATLADQVPNQLDRVQETLAILPMPSWIFDARGRLRYVNEAVLKLFDAPDFTALVALVGGNVTDLAQRLRPRMTSPATIAKATEKSMTSFTPEHFRHEGSLPAWASDRRREQAEALRQDELAISRALKKHTIKNQLISVQHPRQDAELILSASASPIMETTGQLAGALFVTENVTERLLQDGQRDAILAMAGHDLRNPLTPAKALLQQMRMKMSRTGDFTKEINYIDRVLEQLLRIEGIAADLDAIAAYGRGDVSAAMASCDLVKLCESVAAREMDRRPETPVVVRANADTIFGVLAKKHLERAIMMLVDNAVRRSPPNRPVTIRLKLMSNQVKIEINDQGPTIPSAQLEALRAVLERGGAALAMAHGGELDFSTIQTILGLYRSHLSITSKPRQGATFSFALPAPLPDPELPPL